MTGNRLPAWNFRGRKCPACGFEGTLLYKEICWVCKRSLLYCPRCMSIQCVGSKAEGLDGIVKPMKFQSEIRDPDVIAKALVSLKETRGYIYPEDAKDCFFAKLSDRLIQEVETE